jgi:hypothetical protein
VADGVIVSMGVGVGLDSSVGITDVAVGGSTIGSVGVGLGSTVGSAGGAVGLGVTTVGSAGGVVGLGCGVAVNVGLGVGTVGVGVGVLGTLRPASTLNQFGKLHSETFPAAS